MNLKVKIPLISSIVVFLSVAILALIILFRYNKKILREIETYRVSETKRVKQQVREIVDNAYQMLLVSYTKTTNPQFMETFCPAENATDSVLLKKAQNKVLKITVDELRLIRYGNGEGYVWLYSAMPPYKMMMHPTQPELEGTQLDRFTVDTNKYDRNIYEEMAEIGNTQGCGYLSYRYMRNEKDSLFPKIGYVRLFKPKNWIIGSSMYVDYIDKNADNMAQKLRQEVSHQIKALIIIALVFAVFTSVVLLFLANWITGAINRTKERLSKIAKGQKVEVFAVKRNDEIGEMNNSLNELIKGMDKYTCFAKEIEKDNLDVDFKTLSDNDQLGNALLKMRKRLKKAKIEQQKQKQETEKRHWITAGQAKFADILRQENDIERLSQKIISNLVKYIDAVQGGIFIIKDNAIKLMACFACNKEQIQQTEFLRDEGLIGRCIIEGKTMNIDNVPEEYVQINSGLGGQAPTHLLIAPLKQNEETIGAIELAGFSAFEAHHIQFIEKVAENIAATISIAQINSQTNQLLQKTKQQSEELAAREQELRLNMEEMQLSQAEAEENERKYRAFIDAVNHTFVRADFSPEGKLNYANTRFLEIMEYSSKEVKDKPFIEFIPIRNRESFSSLWQKLVQGGEHFEDEIEWKSKYGIISIYSTLTPVRNFEGYITNILFLSINPEKFYKRQTVNQNL